MAAAPEPTLGHSAAPNTRQARLSHGPERERLRPASILLRPAWLWALLTLLINDHMLKGLGLLPGWLTGKLSDVAGLIVAPTLLALVTRARSRAGVAACHVAVGLGFTLLKTVPQAAEAWSHALSWLLPSRLWCDPTDLIALPALAVSWRLLASTATTPPTADRERTRQLVVAALGLFGCVASSRIHYEPAVPRGDMVYWPHSFGGYILDRTTGRRRHTLDGRQYGDQTWGHTTYRAEGSRILAADVGTPEAWRIAASVVPGWQLTLLDVTATHLYTLARPTGAEGDPGYLVAFDAPRGTKLWSSRDRIQLAARAPLRSESFTSWPLAHDLVDGHLFVQIERDDGRSLVALDAASGAERWQMPLGYLHASRPAVSAGLVIVGVWEGSGGDDTPSLAHGEIRAVEAASGHTRWTFVTAGPGPAHEVGATDRVAIAASNGILEVLDLASGRKVGGHNALGVLSATPAAGILLTYANGALVGLRPEEGTMAWRIPFPPKDNLTCAVQGGTFYLSSEDGSLMAIEAKTGRVLWQLDD